MNNVALSAWSLVLCLRLQSTDVVHVAKGALKVSLYLRKFLFVCYLVIATLSKLHRGLVPTDGTCKLVYRSHAHVTFTCVTKAMRCRHTQQCNAICARSFVRPDAAYISVTTRSISASRSARK